MAAMQREFNANANANANDVNNNAFMYLTPQRARTQVPNLSRYQFWRIFTREMMLNEPINVQGELEDMDHFHYKFEQYYLRYLACSGQVNNIITRLHDLRNGGVFPTDDMFKQFLNDTSYVEFNGETLVFCIVQWNNETAVNILPELVNIGCDLTVTNHQGQFVEETIHNSSWSNPFHRVMNIGHFNPQFMPIHFNIVRNANIVLRRHRAHFDVIIYRIQELVGENINGDDLNVNRINNHLLNANVIE
jgi:hypothetical protein